MPKILGLAPDWAEQKLSDPTLLINLNHKRPCVTQLSQAKTRGFPGNVLSIVRV